MPSPTPSPATLRLARRVLEAIARADPPPNSAIPRRRRALSSDDCQMFFGGFCDCCPAIEIRCVPVVGALLVLPPE